MIEIRTVAIHRRFPYRPAKIEFVETDFRKRVSIEVKHVSLHGYNVVFCNGVGAAGTRKYPKAGNKEI
jgi:hypothetical protein